MFDDLQKISASISELLRQDPFPESISPEYLRLAVRDYPARGGKRLRPALVIWCAELLGANRDIALLPAAAAEVFHNWTLVHDDIIDRDTVRRGKPTCHVTLSKELAEHFGLTGKNAARSGRDFAILTGDLQQGWATDLILRSVDHGVAPQTALKILQKLRKYAYCELISGEALDVEFSLRPIETVTETEVRQMIYLKTGALLRFCAETGALLGNGTGEEINALGKFASCAGMAFQLRDDYLGMFGDVELFGKAIGADLREKKATLLLSHTLAAVSPAAKKRLLSLMGQDHYSQKELSDIREIMQPSADCIMEEARKLSAESFEYLFAFPDNPAKQHLTALLDYLVNRTK